jgi:F0F1-type ATP synthase assembly protein I
LGGRGRQISEFEASRLVYRVSSRTARATQRNPVSKKNKQKKKKKKRKKKKKKKREMTERGKAASVPCLSTSYVSSNMVGNHIDLQTEQSSVPQWF